MFKDFTLSRSLDLKGTKKLQYNMKTWSCKCKLYDSQSSKTTNTQWWQFQSHSYEPFTLIAEHSGADMHVL